ncbi:DUF1566 domain-containing protein [Aliiglaciecola sp. 3_MG-2023]|uniref:Lcl C-terminal domain-containing protein n=1 Tax=Aliiglaciecola sp. 3_MG-2023 TaxID=3062644 RepID=UPI0026E23374|nr:DUF1566 domain-containing protein [Aliiglaciecola sp. 3_MG-2023]MDO6691967.1 DUF1566 domain-containing protein [Aliiglaciecola sp. 3_MG-2023]
MKFTLFACAMSLLTGMASAQTCLSDAPETASETQFVDNGDGTVTDTDHDLMWMQCSIGQTWENGSCTGDADALTWQQALQQAHGYEFASLDGWRLPNVKELASLTERQCVRPAINETRFPNTPSDDYWSSTPSLSDPQRAWVVAFFNSSNSIKQKDLFVFVRLVRTAD